MIEVISSDKNSIKVRVDDFIIREFRADGTYTLSQHGAPLERRYKIMNNCILWDYPEGHEESGVWHLLFGEVYQQSNRELTNLVMNWIIEISLDL